MCAPRPDQKQTNFPFGFTSMLVVSGNGFALELPILFSFFPNSYPLIVYLKGL